MTEEGYFMAKWLKQRGLIFILDKQHDEGLQDSHHILAVKGLLMARPLRIAYPGAFYHVISRSNERKDIFDHDSII